MVFDFGVSKSGLLKILKLVSDAVGKTDTQTIQNKTVVLEDNTVKQTTPAVGSIPKDNGTKLVPMARGAANLPLKVKSDGSDLEYAKLDVAGGGTGQTTLSSGTVLIGAGTSGITTKANPAGAFLGDSDVQNNTGAKTFFDTTLLLRNPANSQSLVLKSPAITTARSVIAPLVPYHWDTMVYKDTVNSRVFAFSKDGTILSSGVAGSGVDDVVIAAAIAATPSGGTLLVMPGSYTIGATASGISFWAMDADIIMLCYGVTFVSSTTGHSIWFRVNTGVSMSIYGMKFDGSFVAGAPSQGISNVIAGSTALFQKPKLIRLVDCYIYNFGDGAVKNGGDQTLGVNDTRVDIINCVFTAVSTGSANECVFTSMAKWTNIVNCEFYGNKPFYLTGKNVHISNLYADATGYSNGYMDPINAENISINNLTMIDCGTSLRPMGSGDMQNVFGNLKRAYVNGFTKINNSASFQRNLTLTPFDATHIIETAEFHNINISGAGGGGFHIVPHSLAVTNSYHSLIKNFIIDGAYINNFDSDGAILYHVGYCDIDNLIIRNVRTAPTYSTSQSPIKVFADGHDITLGYVVVEDINPNANANGKILRAIQDTSGSPPTRTITATFREPLLQNYQGSNSTGTPSPTVVIKFYKNKGKFTANGDATTKVFNIPHSLVSSPSANSIRVSAGSTDALGPPVITADATNVIVTYPVAPPTGTGNIILYWKAEAG